MSFNSFVKLFTPKDKVFYNLFESVANNIEVIGEKLHEFVKSEVKATRDDLFIQIKDLETRNDEVTHRIFTELSRNFITPFDREDIHYLATALDDIADHIYASVKKIVSYKVDPKDEGIQNLATIIEIGCKEVKKTIYQLRNMRNVRAITESLVKINSLENQADDILDSQIERIFDYETNAKEVIKMKDIYQTMEVVTDKFEDAGNVVESILVKYA